MDADNYKEIQDDTTTYKYKIAGEKDTYFLAWSTTPWNKIVTTSLAINPKLVYVTVLQNGEKYILAKSTIKTLGDKKAYKLLGEKKGSEFVGIKFELHY